MELIWIVYFFAGIAGDFLITLNIRFIAKERVVLAATTSFVVTALSFFVIFDILTRLSAGGSIIGIFAYALGVGVGTVLALKTKVEKNNQAK
ncbi:MAG: hypothetical protein Q8P39_02415 [Candidatus Yanofskybacteria bacterium]|nr:hypothetical protein [Candidatus Yanofskybacteria bacterium]